MDKIDCDHTQFIVCPYCGHEDQNSWEYHDSGNVYCGSCGDEFFMEREIVVYYISKKIKPEANNDKPILLCSDMIRAYQAGLKTQTRRTAGLEVVNQNPDEWALDWFENGLAGFYKKSENVLTAFCKPRFQVGDTFWCKEAIKLYNSGTPIRYVADGLPVMVNGESADRSMWSWKHKTLPSMFMPRWASRISGKITGVRCERVQNITTEDCLSEGIIDDCADNVEHDPSDYIGLKYANLWESINGNKYPWASNPWVWVYYTSEVKTNVR